MKTRKFDWFDMKNPDKPVYSFQVFKDGKWMNLLKDNKLLMFGTEAERDQARKDFNKKPKKGVITDEVLDAILWALDKYATKIDIHEYGLPVLDDSSHMFMAEQRKIIRDILEKV